MARDGNEAQILERGDIYFVYRPKVEEESPRGLDDVQRLYMILGPEDEQRYRLVAIGRKRMPNVDEAGEQHWAFVERVAGEASDVEEELRRETYETKTRGERHLPAARPAGEGIYALTRHADHTHLAYALEPPEEPDEVQREMNIKEEASYVISVKNPEKPSPRGAGLGEEREADYPKRLQERFGDRRFVAVYPPDFLDYEGAEVILVGATGDVSRELGIELDPQRETEDTAEIFEDLRMAKSRHPAEPLFKGKWE